MRRPSTCRLLIWGLGACLAAGEAATKPAPAAAPTGPLTLASASLFGGDGDEEIAGLAIQSDHTVVAVGSCTAPFPVLGLPATPAGEAKGFVLRLDASGKPRSISFLPNPAAVVRVAPKDRLAIRDSTGAVTILDADGRKKLASFAVPLADGPAMAVDTTGGILLTSGTKLQRYTIEGKLLWEASPPAHGKNRLRACAIDSVTGICLAVGYGMTHTGKQPYKAPYAHAFDKDGKLVWTLWNPDPKDQKGAQFGGTGLMADGTGNGAVATPNGKFLVQVYHDGGNAVTGRDPHDPRQPLDKDVFAGSYQDGPGWGMKGAITTSVIFRVDPTSGKLEKGTWMCAWMNNHTQANSLFLNDQTADLQGDIYVVGASARELPAKLPWQGFRDGEYRGGAFLAVFDKGFALRQCGAFNTGELNAVATRDGLVAIAGRAKGVGKDGKLVPPEQRIRLLRPAGHEAIKGAGDAFIAILQRTDTRPTQPSLPRNQNHD